MRRAALLVVPLFLFACDREPVAPDITPTLNSAVPATQWSYEYDDPPFDLCGYDIVDFHNDVHVTTRLVVNEPGTPSHYTSHIQYHARGVGQNTGQEWIANQTDTRQSNWDENGAPDQYMYLNRMIRFVGLGSAPDFTRRVIQRYTVNANGEMVQFKSYLDPTCE